MSTFQFSVSCRLIGNHFGSMLNGMAAAMILNRTYYLQHPVQTFDESCFGELFLRPWIITKTELRTLLADAGCPDNGKLGEGINYHDRFGESAEKLPRQCAYGNSTDRVVRFDDLWNSAYDFFLPTTGVYLNAASKEVANTLFSHPIDGVARFESFGFIMNAVFEFSNTTLHKLNKVLNGSVIHPSDAWSAESKCKVVTNTSAMTIGVHMRHINATSPNFDIAVLEAISGIRNASADRTCVILVASDRLPSIQRVIQFGGSVGCQVRFAERDVVDEATLCAVQGYAENGPWCRSAVVLDDWYLLMHSDYFIGSRSSTLSYLMANGVAYRAAMLGRTVDPLVWIDLKGQRVHAPAPRSGSNTCLLFQ